jgi:hypothetical protein
MSDSKLKLLTEWLPFLYDKKMIKEEMEQSGGRLMMKGILQKADTLNQNGRVYPRDILEREVRNYQKFIRENRALGECDHPDSSVVELKKVSHIIREAYMDGNVCYGTVEILDTPTGKILNILSILSLRLNTFDNSDLLISLPSFIINAPGVEGSETKSQQINWKSS